MLRRRSTDNDTYELRDQNLDGDHDLPLYTADVDDENAQTSLLREGQIAYSRNSSRLQKLLNHIPLPFFRQRRTRRHTKQKILSLSTLRNPLFLFAATVLAITSVVAILFPSYTHPPARYAELRKRVTKTGQPGAGNLQNEKVFIAASIFDAGGHLAGGKWGECVLELIWILGPDNVYLSIYENDAGETAKTALQKLKQRVQCKHTTRFDDHLRLEEVAHVTLPDGSDRVKRVTYLSEARNRALLPLETAKTKYDKLLYLNDVVFSPIEAAQLLFLTGTGQEQDARPNYRAACAVDFINPVKYYDTFATRDHDGYGIGLPFFPWYTTAGKGISRQQVLAGSDAVSVRSCWGGMVAFDARFFQSQTADTPETAASVSSKNVTTPYHFRSEDDLYWEASECCLIHADIQSSDAENSGIFMNPYVRTAYDWNTLQWLAFARRFERMYTPFHWLLSKAVGMPWHNSRRTERPGTEVEERVWVPNEVGGSFQLLKRVAGHSGYCGRQGLQLMKMDRSSGGKPWEESPIPGTK